MKFFFLFFTCVLAFSQPHPGYWQQHVDYKMDVNINVKTFKYSGTQNLVYTNNSPDTLKTVYYHLYFNAFQPGSEMDVRSISLVDPDKRVGSRIGSLKSNEVGFLHAVSLKQDGVDVTFKEEETVLVVSLAKNILPGESTILSMVFEGQVPKQIRNQPLYRSWSN